MRQQAGVQRAAYRAQAGRTLARSAARATPEGAAAAGLSTAVGGTSGGPSGTWHRLILAEYLAVMLTLFATEILGQPGKGTKDQQDVTKATRTYSGIAVRMTATSVLFFVLALMSGGQKSGKAAAALGGLVTLGTLVNAVPVWNRAAAVFGGAAGHAQAGSGGGNGGQGDTGVGSGGGGGGGGSF